MLLLQVSLSKDVLLMAIVCVLDAFFALDHYFIAHTPTDGYPNLPY